MKYSHRNGETEPPAITGHFWIDRTLSQPGAGYDPKVIEQMDIVQVAYEGEDAIVFVPTVLHDVGLDAMPEGVRWWGPIPCPVERSK